MEKRKSFYENKYLIIKAVNDKILEKMKKTMKKLMLLNLKIREKIPTMNLLKQQIQCQYQNKQE